MHFISRKKACQGCIAMLVRVENQVEATDQIPTHISAWTRLVLVNLGASITRTSSTRTHYICWNHIHMPRLVTGNILGINSACAAAEIFGIWPGIQLLEISRYQPTTSPEVQYDRLYCFPLVMGASNGYWSHETGNRHLNVCSTRGEVPEVQDPCLCDSFWSFLVASLGYHCQARPLRTILGHPVGRIDYPLFLLYNCVSSVV